MKLLFLTDNFPPESNAPASRTYEHCCEWVRQGVDVTVITCAPNFPEGRVFKGYKNRLWQREEMNGIHVIRVWTYIAANKGFLKRTIDFISFSISAFIAGLFVATDVIVATSPQFFTALCGRTLSFFKRRPWIMEVRDIWPESIKTVGAMKDNVFIRYFEKEEKWCYNSARHIVVVTNSFKKNLIAKGVSADKISVVTNGVNSELFSPMEKDADLLAKLGLQGKFVIGYIGTHGMAHKLDFILRQAARLVGTDIHFLLVGGGAEKQNLLALKQKLNLQNVTMLDSVPKQDVRRYISITDVCLVNLRKSTLFTTVIPSKIFENASMQKPILMGVDGEAREIIEKYHAGLFFEPENGDDFIEKVNSLQSKDIYLRCINGCKQLSHDYNRKVLADKMLKIIQSI